MFPAVSYRGQITYMKFLSAKILNTDLSFFYSGFFLSLLVFLYIIPILGLFAGVSISSIYFPLALTLGNFFFIYLSRKSFSVSEVVINVIVLNTLIAVAYLISIRVLDTSYDGLWYHQPAVVKLADGWNPIYNPNYEINQYDKTNFLWIQHYPKSAWIMGACIYKASGQIESAKLINFITIFCVFFYSYHVFSSFFKKHIFYSIGFSLLVSLNPVAVAQLLSNYVDGIIAGMLSLITLALLNLEFQNGRLAKLNWFVLGSSMIIVTNLKFTGLFMAGIVIGIFSLYWWWKREPWKLIFRRYLWIFAIAATSFFVLGFNPYVINYTRYGHVFYPLNLKEQYAVFEQNEPVMLRGRSAVEKFFISLSSETINNIQTKNIPWKNPLSVTRKDIRAFAGTDVRIAGLGPLFLLALILSIAAFLATFYKMSKSYKSILLVVVISILVSVVSVPLAWWARYTPQFFLFPLLLLAFSLITAENQGLRVRKYLSMTAFFILLLNLSIVAVPNVIANRIKTKLIRKEMSELRSRKTPLLINFSSTEFQALRIRLKEANVSFTDCDTLKTNVQELRSIYNLYGYGPLYNKGD